MIVLKFDANYYRDGYVEIVQGECFHCHQRKTVLYSDGSEGEYGGAYLCLDCITKWFNAYEKRRQSRKRRT